MQHLNQSEPDLLIVTMNPPPRIVKKVKKLKPETLSSSYRNRSALAIRPLEFEKTFSRLREFCKRFCHKQMRRRQLSCYGSVLKWRTKRFREIVVKFENVPMKRIYILFALSVLNATAAFGIGYSVSTVGGFGPHQTGSGGEFTLRTSDSFMDSVAEGYNTVAKNQVAGHVNFQTFCVETREYIYPNTSYDVTLSGHTTSGTALTKGAAYLYSQFAQGILSGYDYGIGRTTSAAQLQIALWTLMGDQLGQGLNLSNPFQSLVVSQFGDWNSANEAAASGELGVFVLNMWPSGHLNNAAYARQDQLIWLASASVPDTGSSVMLLGISIGALVLISRRWVGIFPLRG